MIVDASTGVASLKPAMALCNKPRRTQTPPDLVPFIIFLFIPGSYRPWSAAHEHQALPSLMVNAMMQQLARQTKPQSGKDDIRQLEMEVRHLRRTSHNSDIEQKQATNLSSNSLTAERTPLRRLFTLDDPTPDEHLPNPHGNEGCQPGERRKSKLVGQAQRYCGHHERDTTSSGGSDPGK